MRFEIIQDTAHGWSSWVLVTNGGSLMASSSSTYNSVGAAQQAIHDFQVWVGQAPVTIISHEPAKDWRQQAKEHLRKKH